MTTLIKVSAIGKKQSGEFFRMIGANQSVAAAFVGLHVRIGTVFDGVPGRHDVDFGSRSFVFIAGEEHAASITVSVIQFPISNFKFA